ncbi:MAG TPA: hypothetical protein VKB16_25025 [Beijerinckiaceae bacterium]|nr:hypothetical protein [Beijerinckiaceae bacterium]
MAGRPQHLHGNGHDDDRGGHPDASFALGAIGMEDELVRARISHMAERLDDVASLKNDFAQLLEPIAAFAAELPQLKAKLLETESMRPASARGTARWRSRSAASRARTSSSRTSSAA